MDVHTANRGATNCGSSFWGDAYIQDPGTRDLDVRGLILCFLKLPFGIPRSPCFVVGHFLPSGVTI